MLNTCKKLQNGFADSETVAQTWTVTFGSIVGSCSLEVDASGGSRSMAGNVESRKGRKTTGGHGEIVFLGLGLMPRRVSDVVNCLNVWELRLPLAIDTKLLMDVSISFRHTRAQILDRAVSALPFHLLRLRALYFHGNFAIVSDSIEPGIVL